MKKCAACGAEISENNQYCPHCGARVGEKEEEKSRDYWAEQLEENAEAEGWAEESEDWTEEPEGELPDINAPEEDRTIRPKLPKKSNILILAVAALLAVLSITAGFLLGHPEETEPIPGSGMYYCCTSSLGEKTRENQEDWIRLNPNGTFEMVLYGTSLKGKWRLEKKQFEGYLENREIKGSLEDGILSFRYSGVQYVFALPEKIQDAVPQKVEEPLILVTEEDAYTAWAGDYYGMLVILEGTGGFSGNTGEIRDICGRIRTEEGGLGRLLLWNAENKKWERFCIAEVLFQEGTTDFGRMSLEWGQFFGMELTAGSWVVDPGKSPYSYIENLFYIHGTYVDPEEPSNTFLYEIFLKPWGESWEEEGLQPPGYESWYLPMIESGQAMPDNF